MLRCVVLERRAAGEWLPPVWYKCPSKGGRHTREALTMEFNFATAGKIIFGRVRFLRSGLWPHLWGAGHWS